MKNIPEIRFKDFNNKWEVKKLDEVSKINPKSKTLPSKFKYVDLSSVQGSTLKSYSFISKENAPSRAQRLAIKEDIFYQTVRPYQRNNYLFLRDDKDFVFSTGYAQIRALESATFLFSYLHTNRFVDIVLNRCTGTSYPAISSSDLADIEIIKPVDIKEQSRIGNLFKNIDELIENQESMVDSLKSFKKSMLQKMFPSGGNSVPEIRFSDFSDNWEEKRLGDIGNTYSGLSGKTKDDFGHGEASFITYMNVYKNPLSDINDIGKIEIDKKQNEVKFGDILFTSSSETPEEVALSSVWLYDIKNIYLNSFCFGLRIEKEIDSYFIAFLLRGVEFRKNAINLAQGSTRFNISKIALLNTNIKIPSLPEQEKIGNFFKNLDLRISNEESLLASYKNMKKSLLQKMFI